MSGRENKDTHFDLVSLMSQVIDDKCGSGGPVLVLTPTQRATGFRWGIKYNKVKKSHFDHWYFKISFGCLQLHCYRENMQLPSM